MSSNVPLILISGFNLFQYWFNSFDSGYDEEVEGWNIEFVNSFNSSWGAVAFPY